MTTNKVGFNNFKSFGERTQTFSQKPITLVYGANSVGKSSVLHFSLLIEYLKETGKLSLEESYFAGDKLDLGGFENFIHKKDISNKISYQLAFDKEEEINKYFSPLYGLLKSYERKGVFKEHISKKDILKRILNYKMKDPESLYLHKGMKAELSNTISTLKPEEFRDSYESIFIKFLMINKNNSLIQYYRKERKKELVTDYLNHNNIDVLHKKIQDEVHKEFDIKSASPEILALFEKCFNTKETKDLIDVLERKDGVKFDCFDELVIYILQEIGEFEDISFPSDKAFSTKRLVTLAYKKLYVDNIFMNWNRLRFISLIKSIKADICLGLKGGSKLESNLKYFINGELLFTFNSLNKEIIRNEQSNFIIKMKNFQYPKLNIRVKDCSLADLFSPFDLTIPQIEDFIPFQIGYYSNFVGNIYKNFAKSTGGSYKTNSQYLGPIRYVPERVDLILNSNKPIKNKHSKSVRKLTLNVNLRSFKYMPNKRFKLLVARLIMIKTMLKSFKTMISGSPLILDSLNNLKKNKNKISSSRAANSEKIWKEFLLSPKAQKSIENWLSDNKNLTTTYSINIEQHTKSNFFRKLLKLKPINYKKLYFIDKRTNTSVTPKEMGLGISQVLPVLVTLHTLKNYKIFIEQPELHLHPAVQCEIADDIIKSKNVNNNELIIESHSEHMLLRFMRRMRETSEGIIKPDDPLALTPDDVCLLYVDYNGSFTYLNELELDKDGTLLDPWPNGFFEEGYKERFS